MKLVLDASAALEILLKRKSADKLRCAVERSSMVISTDLFKSETANALWKYVRAGFLKKDDAVDMLALTYGLVDEFVDISENNQEALSEAIRLNHSVYDMLYFTLARRNGATLATTDKKLAEVCAGNGIESIG